MVSVIEKKTGNSKAYYLHITLRSNKGYKNLDKYLGTKMPIDLRNKKLEFFLSSQKEILNKIDSSVLKYKNNIKILPKSIQDKELLDISIKFTYNTNRIEGNTLSLKESYLLLKDNISPAKSLRDIKETEAHQKLFLKLIKEKQNITYQNMLNWHYELFKETSKDISGKIRNYQVKISGSKFIPPTPAELSLELDSFFRWYNKNNKTMHPIILSALVHLRLVTIHPFGDGNGRITRLLMNVVLNNSNYPLFIIDYKNRKGYYSALEKSQVKEDDSYFLNWFIKSYFKSLK